MQMMTMLVTWHPPSYPDILNASFIFLFNSLNMVLEIGQHKVVLIFLALSYFGRLFTTLCNQGMF